jgi:hypothetical protein
MGKQKILNGELVPEFSSLVRELVPEFSSLIISSRIQV